jgi:hypothetical protein
MTASAWIALSFGASALVLNLITLAIGYGSLRGTVAALDRRIKVVEAEIGASTDLRIAMGKIETKQDQLFEQLRDLNASIRWMRDPAEYPQGQPRQRRKPPA